MPESYSYEQDRNLIFDKLKKIDSMDEKLDRIATSVEVMQDRDRSRSAWFGVGGGAAVTIVLNYLGRKIGIV